MGVRFDAADDRLYHFGSYPQTSAGFTITAWVRVDVDRNDWSTWLRLSGVGTIVTFGTQSDGLNGPAYYTPVDSVEANAALASTVGVWVPVAASRNGSTGAITAWVQANNAGTTTSYTAALGTGSVNGTPTQICIGGRASDDNNEWFNGSIAHVRIWSAELSQSEIEDEWQSYDPVRLTNLHSNWNFDDATDLTDTVGAKTLTVVSGGSPTSTDSPLSPPAVETSFNLGFFAAL